MTPDGQDRTFADVESCEEDTMEEPTEALNSVEGAAHQHQNDNTSNLDMRVHHHDLSQHSHHPLDNSSDPANALFPHQQQQLLQTQLNGISSSTDTNHIPGSDLLQQHLLTHNTLTTLHHHHQHLPYQQQEHQNFSTSISHQQQQHPFSYHHERHHSGDDENDSIVEATTTLQHDVSVVDVGALQQHTHPTDIASLSEHHHPNSHVSPSRLIQQEHEHQIPLGMVYHSNQYTQQFQQDTQHQTREQESSSSSSVDPTQTSVGIASSMFSTQNSPLTLPSRPFPQASKNTSKISSIKTKNSATRNSKKGGISVSKVTEKRRKLKLNGITDVETSIQRGPPVGKKPHRRRYDNDFKAEVLSHLKGPHTKLSDVARRYGIPENTVREWTKVNVVKAIESARSKNSGQLKANMYDPMKRLTEILMVFFEHNMAQPEHLRQSITTKLIVAKALEARNNLLQRHATQPFLDPKEKKAIEKFRGSDSWAKKFAKRRALKMTGARIKELTEEEVNNFHYSLKQMSTRIRQAGPGYEESSMLIRQAAEKLLLASIIHSTASHRLIGDITTINNRSSRKKNQAHRSSSQLNQVHRQHKQMENQPSKLQPDQLIQTHILRDALNGTSPTPDQHTLSP